MAGRLLRGHQPAAAKAEKHQSWYCRCYPVLTAAAMLGVAYPKDHPLAHKVINAYDTPSYKMTPHF